MALAGAVVCAAAPPAVFKDGAGSLLTTFLGLLAASILPTITLLIGAMEPTGRSVKAINELHGEFVGALSALWQTLAFSVAAVGAVLLASLDFPAMGFTIPWTNIVVDQAPLRAVNMVVGCIGTVAIVRFWYIPLVLRRVLDMRHQIARDVAKRRIAEAAPSDADVSQMFPTKPGFGTIKSVLRPSPTDS